MFSQSIKEFLGSKSNWVGMTAIAGAAVGWYTGTLSPEIAVVGVMGGLQTIFLKDAINKTKPK